MTRLLLVRHAESEHNAQGIVQGSALDGPLSERGREQARALARRLVSDARSGRGLLQGHPVVAVYASPLKRADETASILASAFNLPVRHLPDMREYDWGIISGKPLTPKSKAIMDQLFKAWASGNPDYSPPGGESATAAFTRAKAALNPVLEAHPEGTVIVVSHGRLLKILLAGMLDGAFTRMERFRHSNAGVNVLLREGDGVFRAAKLNDTRHLRVAKVERRPSDNRQQGGERRQNGPRGSGGRNNGGGGRNDGRGRNNGGRNQGNRNNGRNGGRNNGGGQRQPRPPQQQGGDGARRDQQPRREQPERPAPEQRPPRSNSGVHVD